MSPGRAAAPPAPPHTTTGTQSKVRSVAGSASGASTASFAGGGPPKYPEAAADAGAGDAALPGAGDAPRAGAQDAAFEAGAGAGEDTPPPLKRRKGAPGVSVSVLRRKMTLSAREHRAKQCETLWWSPIKVVARLPGPRSTAIYKRNQQAWPEILHHISHSLLGYLRKTIHRPFRAAQAMARTS